MNNHKHARALVTSAERRNVAAAVEAHVRKQVTENIVGMGVAPADVISPEVDHDPGPKSGNRRFRRMVTAQRRRDLKVWQKNLKKLAPITGDTY